jgi:hypothetical protein
MIKWIGVPLEGFYSIFDLISWNQEHSMQASDIDWHKYSLLHFLVFIFICKPHLGGWQQEINVRTKRAKRENDVFCSSLEKLEKSFLLHFGLYFVVRK